MSSSKKYHYVKDLMVTPVHVVTPQTSLNVALRSMIANRVHRLPVVESTHNKKKIVGILSERALRLATDSPFSNETKETALQHLAEHKVEDIMTASVVTVQEHAPIVEAAKLMRVANVGGLPVVNEKEELVGMCTRTNLIDHLIRLLEPVKVVGEDKPHHPHKKIIVDEKEESLK